MPNKLYGKRLGKYNMYLQDFVFLPLDRVHQRLHDVTELLRQTAESQHSSDQCCLRPTHHNTPISPQFYKLHTNQHIFVS